MARYTITYDYDFYQLGCECCSDWESEVTIYDTLRDDNQDQLRTYESCFSVPMMYSEKQLREYINSNYPEWNDFEIDPDTRYA